MTQIWTGKEAWAIAGTSSVSDIWDCRKMMSSEQTETEVFGLFKRSPPPPTPMSSTALLLHP